MPKLPHPLFAYSFTFNPSNTSLISIPSNASSMASGENAISPTPNSSSVWTVSYANAPSSNNSSARQPPGKDLGATFLSGTTISNSLTELYLLFKYLRPKALEKQDIRCFDAWAAIFAKKTTDFEFNVTNNIVQKGRFRYFIKVPSEEERDTAPHTAHPGPRGVYRKADAVRQVGRRHATGAQKTVGNGGKGENAYRHGLRPEDGAGYAHD